MDERIDAIKESHPFLSERESADWPAFNCPQENVHELLSDLKENHGYDFLSDLTAIDHFDSDPRYEVVYHLYSTDQHVYLRIATPCSGVTDPACTSIVSIWPSADWHERETYDMFGISFEGHPDLRRILMWDSYPYHPLRKEFPLAGIDVELPSADLSEVTGTSAKPAPMMGGPFHASQKGHMSTREPRADDESWTEVNEREGETGDESTRTPRELREND
ncbi:NADH-quinone oxidoreductase subunit C [Puniceicoccales bacterium CK1056]|uniref:NADH-quinone oxidoreductase subunit C n=1 Tax=Oceanipulchritudo coccoides TaxID=2706888 RepID=A0A6B2M2S3_9BACT|nr:NADH-quinone oxidoreductase subunit C [Oceanipulchritudo coccoides]NDV62414.1 NADH-quinone oxidoreductase subunit C [Oceanipulchritudo coccoides]